MDEGTNVKPIITAEERLAMLNQERKELKAKVKDERESMLKEAAEMRADRDEKIEKIQVKLKEIQSAIYQYNKLGKVARVDFDVLGKIVNVINIVDSISEN